MGHNPNSWAAMDFASSGSRLAGNMDDTFELKRELLTYDLHDSLDPRTIIQDMERFAAARGTFDLSFSHGQGAMNSIANSIANSVPSGCKLVQVPSKQERYLSAWRVPKTEPVAGEPFETEPVDGEPFETRPVTVEPFEMRPVTVQLFETEPVTGEPFAFRGGTVVKSEAPKPNRPGVSHVKLEPPEASNSLNPSGPANKGETQRLLNPWLKQPNLPTKGSAIARCVACNRAFRNSIQLSGHLRRIHSLYPCGVCEANCGSYLDLLLHRHDATHASRCELCDATFPSRSDLVTHRRSCRLEQSSQAHIGDDPHPRSHESSRCLVCMAVLASHDCPRAHYRDHATSGVECPRCLLVLHSRGAREKHTASCEAEYCCALCRKFFASSPELERHNESAHELYWCERCKRQLRLPVGGLKRHRLEFHPLDPPPQRKRGTKGDGGDGTQAVKRCKFCSLLFNSNTSEESFALHEASHLKYKCRYCALLFDTPEQFALHEASHLKYKCKFCTFLLNTSEECTLHEASHVKYKCKFCSFLLNTLEECTLHEASHIKYKCRVCNLLFNTSEECRLHEVSHIKYKCMVCSLIFNTSVECTVHEVSHSHVRYKCRVCSLLFNTSEECTVHENTHGPIYQCKFCDSFQRTLQLLKRHEHLKHFKCRIPRKV